MYTYITVYASRWPRAIESPSHLHERKNKNLYDSGFTAFGHTSTALRQLLGAPHLSSSIIPSPCFQTGTPTSQGSWSLALNS